MIELQVNAPRTEAEYERLLRRCFPHWGDASVSRWFFARESGGPPADRLMLREGDTPLAGIAIVHRRLRLAGGEELAVGILCGAWTLPEARRQGLFGRTVTGALSVARERGLALLLGFVTDDNPSSRGLDRLGFLGVTATYHTAGPDTAGPDGIDPPRAPRAAVEMLGQSAAALFQRFESVRSQRVRFAYGHPGVWASQFLARPHPTRVVNVGSGAWAVVEEVGDTDRILCCEGEDDAMPGLLASLRARAAAAGRRVFCYTTRPEVRRAAGQAGFDCRSGWIRVGGADPTLVAALTGRPAAEAPAEPAPRLHHRWDIQAGDKM